MITTDKLTVRFGSQTLFENVSIKFTPGNCYGVIGANGAGKSTLLKVIAGDIEPTSGEVHISKGQRIAVLRQDHFAFDNYKVIDPKFNMTIPHIAYYKYVNLLTLNNERKKICQVQYLFSKTSSKASLKNSYN